MKWKLKILAAYLNQFVVNFQFHWPETFVTHLNRSIRLTTFDIVKRLIAASEKEFQRIVEENRHKEKQETNVEQSQS